MNVAVPVTVTVSLPALPKVTLPFRVELPSTLSVESKSTASCTFIVPLTTVSPSPEATVNLSVPTSKLPLATLTVPVSISLPTTTFSLELVVTNLRYEFPASLISNAAALLSGIVRVFA